MLSYIKKSITIIRRVTGHGSASFNVPFQVPCECGTTVSGMRRASWIEAECPSCCHTVFVLPANVYPRTKRVPSNVLGGGFFARINAVIAEMRPDSAESAASATTPARPTISDARPKRRARLRQVLQRRSTAAQLAARRAFTPFRLLMIATLIATSLTGYWIIHKRAIENAQKTWITSREDVETFLQDGNLNELEAALSAAVHAGEVLGKNDTEWRLLLNLRDETRAVNTIATKDLLTALRLAYGKDDQLVTGASGIVQSAATSGTFIVDSQIETDAAGRFVVSMPAVPGRHSVELRISLPAIKDYLDVTLDGRMLFAVTIVTVEPPRSSEAGTWQLEADPDSLVLLTNASHCEKLGLSLVDDPDLEKVVSRQRTFVEESESWAKRQSAAPANSTSGKRVRS